MKKIIIFNGFPLAGKDTCCRFIEELLGQARRSFLTISSVDKVKQAAKHLGWDEIKDEQGREFLSVLKDLSTKYYDGPFRYIESRIDNSNYEFYLLMIREPSEIAKIKKAYGEACVTVLVRGTKEQAHFTNTGDSQVLNFSYDFHLDNYGCLNELKNTMKTFLQTLDERYRIR